MLKNRKLTLLSGISVCSKRDKHVEQGDQHAALEENICDSQ